MARLLDRHGQALSIPVTTALRTDADGSQWLSAGLVLAPLAVGDYLIEMSERDEKTLVAFAVVP